MAHSYGSRIVTDGLIYYLDAANVKSYITGSGIWYDISKTQLTASLDAGTGYLNQNSGVLSFSGSNYVNCGKLPLLSGLSNMSVDCWYYNTNIITGSAVYQSIVGVWDGVDGWLIHTSLTSGYRTIVMVGGGVSYGGIDDNPTGSWNNVVLAFDGTLSGDTNRLKMYYNGVQRTFDKFAGGAIPSTIPDSTSFNVRVGDIQGLNRFFYGFIPTVKIYNKTLSPNEVSQNYNAMKGRFNLP